MRLFDNIRRKGQQGREAVQRGMERAREEWEDTERKLRQRMRIYPQKLRAAAAASSSPAQEQRTPSAAPKPIISVHGKDIREEDLDTPAA